MFHVRAMPVCSEQGAGSVTQSSLKGRRFLCQGSRPLAIVMKRGLSEFDLGNAGQQGDLALVADVEHEDDGDARMGHAVVVQKGTSHGKCARGSTSAVLVGVKGMNPSSL